MWEHLMRTTPAPRTETVPPPSREFLYGVRAGTALLLVLLSACSVGDDMRKVCAGKTYSEYIAAVVTAKLAYERRCTLIDPAGSRDPQRRALLLSSFPSYLTEARDRSATDKRSSWDPSCVTKALADVSCAPGLADAAIRACATAEVTGCLAPGRACSLPEECDSGYCKGVPADSQCGSGTCVAYASIGAACPEGSRACDPAKAYCKNSVCQPREAAGLSCQFSGDCAPGLSCLRAQVGDAQGTCGTPTLGQAGAPCNRVEDIGKFCVAGLSCYKDGNGTYLCQPTRKPGEVCTTSEACLAPATCVRAQVTDPSGLCRQLSGTGGDCSLDPGLGTGCQLTLSCYTFEAMMAPSCQPLPENGQRCAPMQLDCLTGVCDTRQNPPRCSAKTPTGLACRENTECVSGICDRVTQRCQSPACL